jgi:hypothetical protein
MERSNAGDFKSACKDSTGDNITKVIGTVVLGDFKVDYAHIAAVPRGEGQ